MSDHSTRPLELVLPQPVSNRARSLRIAMTKVGLQEEFDACMEEAVTKGLDQAYARMGAPKAATKPSVKATALNAGATLQ